MQADRLDFLQRLNDRLLLYVKPPSSTNKTQLIADLQAIAKVDINFQHLQKTQFNKTLILVAKIKDISDDEDLKIIKLARDLLMKWKQQYNQLKQKRKDSDGEPQGAQGKKQKKETQGTEPAKIEAPSQESQSKGAIDQLESSRQGCVRIMIKALQQEFQGEQLTQEIIKKLEYISLEIEKGLYEKHDKTVSQQYREDSRLLISTLRKEENQALRVRVISEDISISELVACRPETLIDQRVQEEMMKSKEQNIQARRSDWIMEQYKKTAERGGGLMCINQKCKSTKTMTNLVQTRGADEPMTEFNTCFNCGKTWKF